jgi:hypothetical protein
VSIVEADKDGGFSFVEADKDGGFFVLRSFSGFRF